MEFFPITTFAKLFFLNAWQGFEYVNKYLLNNDWWALESMKIKEHYEIGYVSSKYSYLHFILQRQFSVWCLKYVDI